MIEANDIAMACFTRMVDITCARQIACIYRHKATLDGMMAENVQRAVSGFSPAYADEEFRRHSELFRHEADELDRWLTAYSSMLSSVRPEVYKTIQDAFNMEEPRDEP